ncbi:MAG TPA: hypothetical protein VLR52_02820, partial [Bacteroidales bacterium]|nr:hypothetical protein [Bacteroidales bacterium]
MKKVTRFVQMLILFTAMLFSTGAWAQTTLLSESFDGGVLPTGWSHSIVVGTTSWTYNAVGGYLSVPATTHTGAYNARFNYSGYNQKALLITPSINFGTAPVGFLKFWHAQGNWGGDQDSLTVLYRTGPADTWKKLAIYTANITAWTQESVSLPSVNGTYQIAFRGNAEYGYGVCLDDVLVTALTPPGPATITLGTGTTSVGTYPYNTFWMDNRTEILYSAAEMLTAGATAGNITNFGLNIATAYSYLMNGFKIEMKATTATSLTDFVEGGFTTVYNTPLNITATGWQNFTLSTPFAWDGTSNIIVHICFDNTAYGSSNYVYTSVVAGSVVSRYQDNGTGCVMTGATTYTNRPNARLTVIPETGLVQGVVKSAYSGLPIVATVTSAG